jgi:hypothetical protein
MSVFAGIFAAVHGLCASQQLSVQEAGRQEHFTRNELIAGAGELRETRFHFFP